MFSKGHRDDARETNVKNGYGLEVVSGFRLTCQKRDTPVTYLCCFDKVILRSL